MKIADIELGDRPLFLAPMEDVTDPSFRYMCKRFGADVVYTEFISSDGLIRDAGKSLAKLRIAESERPVGIQLYGHLVEPMVEAARIAEAADPDIIDINFGCPVKKIAGRGAGSGMMRDVPLMVEMTRRIVEAVKKPVTVKTRLGWDEESKNIEEIALRLQDVGIAALTIHGRTRAQMYRGEADWTLIGKVKNNPAIRIPIIGNGDIDSGPKALDAMKIADIELGDRPLFLAPMEDVTDPSFRYMCKRFGADVVYTEFISSDGLIRDAGKSLAKLRIAESERPVGIQLYGHLVEPMVEAARIAEAADPDIIDINFGCPVKKIAGRGAGSGMMRDVPLMVEMTRRIVEAVKKPVTVKTRLGWDEESKNIEEIALRLQDVGIAALTIHGRTRAQMYRGEADWTLIGKVKNNPAIRIPIIGNGDIDSGPKAREMFDRYGVDGVMIGRATYGRPWIFREVKHFLETGEVMPQPSVAERVEIAKEHLAKSLEIKGDRVGILEMRRHLSNYFKGLPNFKETRLKLVTLFDPNELYATLDSIADRWGDFDVSGVIPAPLSHDV